MVQNATECVTGAIVHQDVLQVPEKQWQKKFHDEETNLSIKKAMPKHVVKSGIHHLSFPLNSGVRW